MEFRFVDMMRFKKNNSSKWKEGSHKSEGEGKKALEESGRIIKQRIRSPEVSGRRTEADRELERVLMSFSFSAADCDEIAGGVLAKRRQQ